MKEVVKVSCVKHIYPDKTEVSICGLDFIVNKGERIVILGSNGSGKTTLLSHILGLLKPVQGKVAVFGMDPVKQFSKLREKIGVVFQNVDEQIIGPTVYDDIAFSLRNAGQDKETVKWTVAAIAENLGINPIMNKVPHYLSGGQKKKVAMAGALVMSPELLVLDEPFDGLDPKSKREMIDLINDFNKRENLTTIITTHDINLVPYIADVIYILDKGNIVTSGTPEEIFQQKAILEEAKLEPPILVELFSRLRRKGLDVSLPINIEQAELELDLLLEARKIRGNIESFTRRESMLRLRENLVVVEEERLSGKKGFSIESLDEMMQKAIGEVVNDNK